MIHNHPKHTAGFALLVSIITTSMLLLVSFVVANIAYKQLLITYSAKQSQTAFYAADSGIECATFWDLKDPNNPGTSAFDPSTAGTITCNNITIASTGPNAETVPTVPPEPAIIGGSESASNGNESIFSVSYADGTCSIVHVIKNPGGSTVITSSGYNTCDKDAGRRYERTVTITYGG